ncbi:MAG: hypothetical protein R3B49_08035 [Phycisphaerales bacterium]
MVETLRANGAMDYTIVVNAAASDPGVDAVHRALLRVHDGRALHVERQGGGARRWSSAPTRKHAC